MLGLFLCLAGCRCVLPKLIFLDPFLPWFQKPIGNHPDHTPQKSGNDTGAQNLSGDGLQNPIKIAQ